MNISNRPLWWICSGAFMENTYVDSDYRQCCRDFCYSIRDRKCYINKSVYDFYDASKQRGI